jgi:hypothetical protein
MKSFHHIQSNEREMEMKKSWDEINIMMGEAKYPAKRIIRVLFNLPRNQATYSWEEMNSAFMKSGFSNKMILDMMKRFSRTQIRFFNVEV